MESVSVIIIPFGQIVPKLMTQMQRVMYKVEIKTD